MALLTALGTALAMSLATALVANVAKVVALAPARLLRWIWRLLLGQLLRRLLQLL